MHWRINMSMHFWKTYTLTAPGGYQQDGLNSTLLSYGHILQWSPTVGMMNREYDLQGQEEVEPPMARLQLTG